MSSIERYVPLGGNSLSSDAPGWSSTTVGQGPTCWKCKGRKQLVDKKALKKGSKEHQVKKAKLIDKKPLKECSVCHGKGFLPPKRIEMTSLAFQPGMITRKRRCPDSWQCTGPKAHAVSQAEKLKNGIQNDADSPLFLLHKANSMKLVEAGVTAPCRSYNEYPWYPSNKGEQLCNLVGDWRILQRVGSHRWTTDDIVTAKIAIEEISKLREMVSGPLRYLDLGCGNGSVLQMTSWGLMGKHDVKAFGIEARSEAAALARRSLSFNIGKDNIGNLISVIHGDFRDLERKVPFEGRKGDNSPEQLKHFYDTKEERFQLVTGTPPYFQVDFSTRESLSEDKDDKIVTAAVINQGGMPTSIQSAPARCEFRGGIEEYLQAASSVMADDGIFVVCENWLNNERVYSGAKSAGLRMKKVYPIKGKCGRKENLFGVYVLEREIQSEGDQEKAGVVTEPLSVRTGCGKWTLKYADLLETMSIPANHDAK